MDEIAGWTRFDDDRRRLILEQVARRRALAAVGAMVVAACAAPPQAGQPGAAPGPAGAPSTAAPQAPPAPPAVPPAAPPLSSGPAQRPALGLFSDIKAPRDVDPKLELSATGSQIFRCEEVGGSMRWAFRLPEAELRDASGRMVGRHGADYSFEHVDGSRLIGSIVGYDSAPDPDALRWLLLRTQSFGQGTFEHVTYVQRVDTQGGMPPAQCASDQLNQILRVPFSARFIFYKPH